MVNIKHHFSLIKHFDLDIDIPLILSSIFRASVHIIKEFRPHSVPFPGRFQPFLAESCDTRPTHSAIFDLDALRRSCRRVFYRWELGFLGSRSSSIGWFGAIFVNFHNSLRGIENNLFARVRSLFLP